MITATCKTETCIQNGIEYFVLGDPSRVECGTCAKDCELTNPTDDPVIEETPTP